MLKHCPDLLDVSKFQKDRPNVEDPGEGSSEACDDLDEDYEVFHSSQANLVTL